MNHMEMSLKSVLTHKDFARELAPDEEIQQLLKKIWSVHRVKHTMR